MTQQLPLAGPQKLGCICGCGRRRGDRPTVVCSYKRMCTKCGETKAATDFYPDKRYRDGLGRRCKGCLLAESARHRHENLAYHTRRRAEWGKQNPDKQSEINKRAVAKYYRSHREQEIARRKAKACRDRLENPEKVRAYGRAYTKKYRQQYPERFKAYDAKKRAKRRSAPGNASSQQVASRMAFWGYKCWICGGSFEAIDHVIPLARGGSHWSANLRPICYSCNGRKGATDWRLWAA